MSIISSNTLFHFTERQHLLSILNNGFYPRYSLERYELGDKYFKLAVPMVCFCDIPLSQVKNHVQEYGSYGIGMARHWVEKRKLNPVLYLKKESTLSANIMNMLSNLSNEDVYGLNDLHESKKALLELIRYLKPYEGILHRNNEEKKKRFYDEREWRYVPNPDKYKSKKYVLSESEFNDIKTKNEANLKLEKANLSFKPVDIRYIIVNEFGLTDIFHHLTDISKKNKYDSHTLRILTSKILTYEQIKYDF